MNDQLIISVRAEALLASLSGATDRLHAELRRTVDRLSIWVQGQVKEDKLTGQVLHVRSGTLRRSINRKVIDTPGGGVIATVGTNVVYAAIHEYGFNGIENVRAHTRRSPEQLALPAKKRPLKREGTIFVRAHTRHMVMPERSYLRSTLREDADQIRTELRAAVLRGLEV